MKQIWIRLFVLVSLIWPAVILADDTDPSGSMPSNTVLRPKPTTRPLAPSRVYIGCEYGEGYVQFTFPTGIYSVNVTLSSENYMWTGYASTDFPKMEIPSLVGEYTIICEANDGRVFYGTLVFATGD